jgi:hypothetical protein
MAVSNTGFADVVAYYGDAKACRKHLLHPTDWQAAKRAPDAAKWSLAPQSVISVIDATRHPETGYSSTSPSNTNSIYPFPTGGL